MALVQRLLRLRLLLALGTLVISRYGLVFEQLLIHLYKLEVSNARAPNLTGIEA